jgi:hypothetical protein
VSCEAVRLAVQFRKPHNRRSVRELLPDLGKGIARANGVAGYSGNGEASMHEVLISYSKKDKKWADGACSVLEARGIPCWIAPRDITPGAEWGAAIISGIDACKVMVLIFSASANESPQVRREVERAISKGLTVVPCRIEDVMPAGAMEYALGNTHWLDVFTPPVERQMKRLAESVQALLPRERGASSVVSSPSVAPDSAGRDELRENSVSIWKWGGRHRLIAAAGFTLFLLLAVSLMVALRPRTDAVSTAKNPGLERETVEPKPTVAAKAGRTVGFVPLFNGKDLSGWQGDLKIWTAEDGTIVAHGDRNPVNGWKGNSYLIREGTYSDFELRLQFKLWNHGNSGVQFRGALKNDGAMQGHQAEIGFIKGRRGHPDRDLTGNLYDEGTESGPSIELSDDQRARLYAAARADGWNDLLIRCEADHIVIEINGITTVDWHDPQGSRSGFFALQSHGGMKPLIAFRDIRVRDLSQ